MPTMTATVIAQGLALTPGFMEEHDLRPGARISIALAEIPRKIRDDIQRLIEETRGMFSSGPSMANELMQDRREDERRFNEKW